MPHDPTPPYPKNAPGDFYVENGYCLTCEAPCREAPDLIAHDEDEGYPHCYFRKQPETPEEVERAIMACHLSCVRAVRYAGKNPKILKRFEAVGSVDSCDVLAALEVGGERPQTLQEKLEGLRQIKEEIRRSDTARSDDPLFDRDLGR